MHQTFDIRPATNADGEAVRQLVFAVLREHGLTPDAAGVDADLYDIESSYLRAGGAFDLLVDMTGAIAGTVGLIPTGEGRCELRKMYLDQAHRGRGLGKRLLRHALGRAMQLGFRRVELETIGVFQAAIGLYESVGFRPFVPDHVSSGPEHADRFYLQEGGLIQRLATLIQRSARFIQQRAGLIQRKAEFVQRDAILIQRKPYSVRNV
ncbi:MAG: GNAT family N-acetyltransferase [Planctomycetes bacterium]|nr:GNAT family N-acetyltransferase [Planctomycetota bacterium]